MLVMLKEISEVYFPLLSTNESFTVAGSRCRQILKYENFASSFGRPFQVTNQLIARKFSKNRPVTEQSHYLYHRINCDRN